MAWAIPAVAIVGLLVSPLFRGEVRVPGNFPVLGSDEIADFGTPQQSLSFRVAQLSAAVGRGIPAEGARHRRM